MCSYKYGVQWSVVLKTRTTPGPRDNYQFFLNAKHFFHVARHFLAANDMELYHWCTVAYFFCIVIQNFHSMILHFTEIVCAVITSMYQLDTFLTIQKLYVRALSPMATGRKTTTCRKSHDLCSACNYLQVPVPSSCHWSLLREKYWLCNTRWKLHQLFCSKIFSASVELESDKVCLFGSLASELGPSLSPKMT